MICYIGLGSNLTQPNKQLQQALETLDGDAQLELLKVSSFYQSRALIMPGSAAQNDYINAVACLATDLSAQQLLQKLHHIEALQGRERLSKWAPRTLDLDILLYGQETLRSDTLHIPHAQLAYRNFVIHPLFEIAGDISIPGLGQLSKLVRAANWDGLAKLEEHSL